MAPGQKFHLQVDTTELKAISQVLNLLNHRNKNQHRRSSWWKWLSMLRRSVGKLLQESKAKDEKVATARVAFMSGILIPKCYLSFTQLVADNQFSALGLVLLAELARTRTAVGAPNLSYSDVFSKGDVVVGRTTRPEMALLEDVGEVLARPRDEGGIESPNKDSVAAVGDLPAATAPRMEGRRPRPTQTRGSEVSAGGPVDDSKSESNGVARKEKKKEKKLKQRRRLNPIDDLFEGLS